jgi:hypothetical protein
MGKKSQQRKRLQPRQSVNTGQRAHGEREQGIGRPAKPKHVKAGDMSASRKQSADVAPPPLDASFSRRLRNLKVPAEALNEEVACDEERLQRIFVQWERTGEGEEQQDLAQTVEALLLPFEDFSQDSNPLPSLLRGPAVVSLKEEWSECVTASNREFQYSLDQELNGVLFHLMEEDTKLSRAFAEHQINFYQEILPLFEETYTLFTNLLFAHKAWEKNTRNYDKQVKALAGALQVIHQYEGISPVWEKARLQEEVTHYSRAKVEGRILQGIQELCGRPKEKEFLSPSIEKAPHLHPIWKDFQVQLFKLLNEKISATKAYQLISLLFCSLLPHWYQAQQLPSADLIRQNVQRCLEAD